MGYQKLTPIIATGSSAPRYLDDRFSDIVNLKDFGAVGDGETDDSTAWAAWRTALQNGGMPYIPKGNYLLGEEIIHAPKGHLGGNSIMPTYEDNGPVLGEFYFNVYVDASVASSGDGYSSATAFKTIGEAIAEAKNHSKFTTIVNVSAGTYNETIYIECGSIYLRLLGDIVLNGCVVVRRCSLLIVDSDTGSKTFIVNGNISSYYLSCIKLSSALDVWVNSNTNNYTGDKACICALDNGLIEIDSSLHLASDGMDHYIWCRAAGISGSSALTCSGDVNVAALFIHVGSFLTWHAKPITMLGNAGFGVRIISCSICSVENLVLSGVYSTQTVQASDSAVLLLGSLTISNAQNNCPYGIQSAFNAYIYIASYLSMKGNYTYRVCNATSNGALNVSQGATVVNNATGMRYYADRGGQIFVDGSGANRLPGDTAGSTHAASFGYYG